MTKKKEKIKKGDRERVMLSETLPNEVPIIFSNDGFYQHCLNFKNADKTHYPLLPLFEKMINADLKFTIPYHYKIRKNAVALRTLSLMHPSWQHKFISFYDRYNTLICYYCSNSKISLRYPAKIASATYLKNKNSNIHKYKSDHVSTIKSDRIAKHSSTYFSYPYDREHKFFKSEQFLNLEKQYSHFWQLDVSRCFESIYTHSISWALKSKEFTKVNLDRKMFGSEFDKIMQQGKNNETNGIVIGPEISRIFAEIIFQDVDKNIISRLAANDCFFDSDYTIRRYVDDIFIFSKNENIAKNVSQAVSVELFNYNLHLNDNKFEKYERPFFTSKSRVIFNIDKSVNEFFDKFIERTIKEIPTGNEDETETKINITLKKIYSQTGLKNNFIQSVKSTCSANNEGYGMSSNYIISCLSNRMVEITENGERDIHDNEADRNNYVNAILCLIDTMFFFYTVEPTVGASYKISRAIILAIRFSNIELEEYAPSIKQRVLELFIKFYESQKKIAATIQKKESTALEVLNILIALKEMGDDYLIPESELVGIFPSNNNKLNYFEIITCLYYTGGLEIYEKLNKKVEAAIQNNANELDPFKKKAEQVYILLDTLTCPFVDIKLKKKILNKIKTTWEIDLSSMGSADQQLEHLEKHPWFVNWQNLDLLTLLEKKELSVSY